MPNAILTLLLVFFIPSWLAPEAVLEAKKIFSSFTKETPSAGGENENRFVESGAETEENPADFEQRKISLFPLETASASGFIPVRKENFRDLKLWADSSVAIDSESGTILHYDNGRKKTQIASLTKIMTAILAVEKIGNLQEEIVTIPREALLLPGTLVGCPRTGYCLSNRLYVGEKIKALDLMKAMLLNSANDAAYSLAYHIAGSEENFVKMMNEKAKALDLKDTHFCTSSGLEIDGREDQCYSTAYDIARIASASLDCSPIWEIMKIPEGRFFSADGRYMHELKNTDRLLLEMPNCLGGKTGFTPLAGKSLLLGATDPAGRHKIIAVILNDENRWEDMKILADWIFDNYSWK